MADYKYKQKYLKYKLKYLELKQNGGRLLDITQQKIDLKKQDNFSKIQNIDKEINEIDKKKTLLVDSKTKLSEQLSRLNLLKFSDVQTNCQDMDPNSGIPIIEDANFNYCNDVNDDLSSKNNSFIIIFNLIEDKPGDIHPNIYLNKSIKSIIQKWYAKPSNVFLITTLNNTPTNITNKINVVKIDNSNYDTKIDEVIKEINKRSESNNSLTIFNLAHGHMMYYNNDDFISSGKGIVMTINQYYNKFLEPFYNSSKNFNIMLVLNNCYSIYSIFKKLRKLTQQNTVQGQKKNRINLVTYSSRPYIKYLVWLQNIIHFVNDDILIRFNSATTDTNKFTVFKEAIDQIEILLFTPLVNPIDISNKEILLYTLSTEDPVEIRKEFDLMINIINPDIPNNIFQMVKVLLGLGIEPTKKSIANTSGIDLSKINLYSTTTNSSGGTIPNADTKIIEGLEQAALTSFNTYIFNRLVDTMGNFYDYQLNDTIKKINFTLKSEAVNWAFNEWFDSPIMGLKEITGIDIQTEMRKLLEMSFNEQTDILFVIVEQNEDKRKKIRNMQFKELL